MFAPEKARLDPRICGSTGAREPSPAQKGLYWLVTNRNRKPSTAKQSSKRRWYKADLHLHTPASSDYEQPDVTYLDIVRKAAEKEVDIIAITDHNTVAGVAAIRQEIEWLTRLESEGRLREEEKERLEEWRRLANKVLVLPGFEFTATFGFHILGIFPPETSVRELEHILLSLHVPPEKLDEGSTETGASTDVLTAYRVIREAGGIPIAAHANSTHGVAMRNFPFGGQTKIAYTQDPNLMALEVTDMESRSRHSTCRFFNGSKPEYPRRMHCIQSSDAHRLVANPKNPKRLGVGDRVTEMLLDEPSFQAIYNLFLSKQFDRIRPYRPKDKPVDHLAMARAEGPNAVQSFHESASRRGGRLGAILADVCAFANTDGGTIYVGASARKGRPKGLANPKQVEQEILQGIAERLTPPLEVKTEILRSEGANILRITVPEGSEKPYCLDGSKFYVRNDAETDLAVRDEIVALVLESVGKERAKTAVKAPTTEAPAGNGKSGRRRRRRRSSRSSGGSSEGQESRKAQPQQAQSPSKSQPQESQENQEAREDPFYLPQIGVEIVNTEKRNGVNYYAIRDLRNGRVVTNVTRQSARKLWNYAIAQTEDNPVAPDKVQWKGDVGLVRVEKRAGKVRYDLALKEGKNIRVFYGVTEDGMEGPWAQFVKKGEAA